MQVKEFGCAAASPSGLAVVVGNFNKYFVYSFNLRSEEWEEAKCVDVPNVYTITALAWKPDGRCVGRARIKCSGFNIVGLNV